MLFEAVAHALDDLLTHPLILYLYITSFSFCQIPQQTHEEKKGKKMVK